MPHDECVPEDPMGLVGMVLPGAPGQLEAMAECFVEEYVRLGWDERRLMTLFVNPRFLATHRIYRQKGEHYVRELIRTTCAKWRIAPAQNCRALADDDRHPAADEGPKTKDESSVAGGAPSSSVLGSSSGRHAISS